MGRPWAAPAHPSVAQSPTQAGRAGSGERPWGEAASLDLFGCRGSRGSEGGAVLALLHPEAVCTAGPCLLAWVQEGLCSTPCPSGLWEGATSPGVTVSPPPHCALSAPCRLNEFTKQIGGEGCECLCPSVGCFELCCPQLLCVWGDAVGPSSVKLGLAVVPE